MATKTTTTTTDAARTQEPISVPRAILEAARDTARVGSQASWKTALAYGGHVLAIAEQRDVAVRPAAEALADRIKVDGFSTSYGAKAAATVQAVDAFPHFATATKSNGTPRFSPSAVSLAKAFVTGPDEIAEAFKADVLALGATGSLDALVKRYREWAKDARSQAKRDGQVSVDDKLPPTTDQPEPEQLKTDAQRSASAARLVAQAVELVGVDEVFAILATLDSTAKVQADAAAAV